MRIAHPNTIKQFKVLICGLLASASFVAIAPQCHADYVVDENASQITDDFEFATESYPSYSVSTNGIAALDGTILGTRSYSANGGKTQTSSGKGGSGAPAFVSSVRTQWKWVGDEPAPAFTIHFFPVYAGSTGGSSSNLLGSAYSTSVELSGTYSATLRPIDLQNSPQDTRNEPPGLSYSSSGSVLGPTSGYMTQQSAVQSYPCVGIDRFQTTTKVKLPDSQVMAVGKHASVTLYETVLMSAEVAVDVPVN